MTSKLSRFLIMKHSATPGFPRRFYLFLSVVALLSLLVTGGTFSHAEEFGLQDHVHTTADTGDHGHATESPACNFNDRPIHCGSNILMIAMHEELSNPAGVHQLSIGRFEPLAGLPIIPEPPPPRSFPVFDI